MKHHLYGLDVKLNISKFYITDLKTDRELEFGNFRISLRKGNFRFPIPFGLIMKKSKKNFIIICKILEPEMYGQLGNINLYKKSGENFQELIKSKFWIESNDLIMEGLVDYLLTLIYINANQFGYESPFNIRSFFNRNSKGVLSKRGEKIDKYIKEINNIKRTFTLHEALSIKGWYKGNGEIILLPFPRYEILENNFTFPLNDEFFTDIKNYWSSYLNQKSDSIINSMDIVIKTLKENLSKFDDIENIKQTNLDKDIFLLPLSPIVLNDGNKFKIELEDRSDKIIKLNFINNKILDIDFIIVVENSVYNLYSTQMNFFISNMKKIANIKYEVLLLDKVLEDKNQSDSIKKPILFILDDKSGYDGLYRIIKRSFCKFPHKIILLKTIQKFYDSKLDDILFQTLLPLLHRSLGYIPWRTTNSTFSNIIGVAKSSRMGGHIFIYSIATYSNNSIDLKGNYDYRFSNFSDDLTNPLIDILSQLDKFTGINLLILHGIMLDKPIITGRYLKARSNCKNNLIVVHIDENEQGRIINYDSSDKNPYRGAFCFLGKNVYFYNYLGVSTGFPDINDEIEDIGFTRPILIQICNEDLDDNPSIEPNAILNVILDLSFMHPTSFSQTALPLPLYSAMKGLDFQSYSIGVPNLFSNIKGVL